MNDAATLSPAVPRPAHVPEAAVYDAPEQLEAIRARMPPGTPQIPNAKPINLDPPEHGQCRAPQQAFSRKAMLALKGDIRTLADQRAMLFLPAADFDASERPPAFHGGLVIGIDSLWLRWDA
jgi:cytochrome P450